MIAINSIKIQIQLNTDTNNIIVQLPHTYIHELLTDSRNNKTFTHRPWCVNQRRRRRRYIVVMMMIELPTYHAKAHIWWCVK